MYISVCLPQFYLLSRCDYHSCSGHLEGRSLTGPSAVSPNKSDDAFHIFSPLFLFFHAFFGNIYIYLDISIYIYILYILYIYIYIYSLYICTIYIYIYIYIHIYVYMYICMCTIYYIYIPVCIYIYIFWRQHSHIQKIFAYHVFIVFQTWVLVCYFERHFSSIWRD